jgi:hypothetical protein
VVYQRGLAYRGAGARPYRWIRALTTYGVLLPDVETLWARWWSIETIGRAVSCVQYLSALVYDKDDNPVFTPWTRDHGGGPPCLWEEILDSRCKELPNLLASTHSSSAAVDWSI